MSRFLKYSLLALCVVSVSACQSIEARGLTEVGAETAQARECPRSYAEAVRRGHIALDTAAAPHRFKVFRRDDQGTTESVVARGVIRNNDYWATHCPVFLGGEALPQAKGCEKKVIFKESSALSIIPVDGDRYFMQIDDTAYGTIRAFMRQVNDRFGARGTVWLESSETSSSEFDFFVFLLDTEATDDFPEPYKAYYIEAFPKDPPTDCAAHLPRQSLCAPDATDSDCKLEQRQPESGSATKGEVGTMQTDTSHGHEPPP